MWYLKFKVKHKRCIYTTKTLEYKITDLMYPVGHSIKKKKKKNLYLSAIHILEGPEQNKNKYLNYLKNHRNILKLEVSQNILFTLVKEKYNQKEYEIVYNPSFFHVTPVINGFDGYEIWEVACWDKKPLQELIKYLRKSKIVIHFEILKFVKKILNEAYLLQMLPRLSLKQREAIELAYTNRYYSFPKKTDLNKLAKIMGISKATFQEHLKRAEAKLMPFLLRK